MRATEEFDYLVERDWKVADKMLRLDGSSLLDGWFPIEVELMHHVTTGSRHLRPTDAPHLTARALVIASGCLAKVREVFEQYGEWLPLVDPGTGEDFWLFNCTVVSTTALDEAASDLDVASSGRVRCVLRYVFNPDVVRSLGAFLIPQDSRLLLTGDALDCLLDAELEGLELRTVWTDSPSPAGT